MLILSKNTGHNSIVLGRVSIWTLDSDFKLKKWGFRLDWNTNLITCNSGPISPYVFFSCFPLPKHFPFVTQIRKAPTLCCAPKLLWRRAQGLQSIFPQRNLTVTSHYIWNSGYFCPCASFSACPHQLLPARTMTNFLPSLVPSTPENIHIHLEFLTTKYF